MNAQAKLESAEFRAGADWKFAMMGSFSEPKSRRVFTAAELHLLAQSYRSDVAPNTVRAAVDLFVSAGTLRRVGHGIYLNRKCVPVAELIEVAQFVRTGAVISLQSVLGECGFLNNPSVMVTAVLPVVTGKRCNDGDVKTKTGDTFRFTGVPERLFPKSDDDQWRMLQPGRACAMFRPEAALLHWVYLSSEGRGMTPPPVDVDMETLDSELLATLARRWSLSDALADWHDGAAARDFGEESEASIASQTSPKGRAKPKA